ncbi:non-specific lipid transfer protein GPI-anchored 9-like [Lolium rigidum]|uniref:non-specific lipid transfer protein GPI-anchored 9-like n=1 Tax=Lolium rigidum TaxID=89674 RepID=UPI001F5C7CE2|nr:non-specific lipid transfer protein GPI-anchored 9-like [Lolium rigidum]
MAMRAVVVLLAAAAAVSLFAAGASAQTTEPPSCALKLVACAAYMNGTDAETPPDTCCGPLRDAVQNQRTCLCELYVAPAIFAAYRINVTDALRLPKRCGISEDVTSCPTRISMMWSRQYHREV